MVVDTTETSDSAVGTVKCNECTKKIPVAIWDDEVLSGRLLPVCMNCTTPEFNLWDASEMESHPIPDNKEWTVLPKHRNREEQLKEIFDGDVPTQEELEESFNFVGGDASHFFEEPDELNLEIYIRNPDDEKELEKARDEARKIIEDY